ncbi:MAG: FAD-dependent oxidoreductase [Candidatus Eisenbacteria bacterium]|nr:FAD-dependent oxidoreductase [Candidatus Eisenbacteria bacterium]
MSTNPAQSASERPSKICFTPVASVGASCAELVEPSPCSQACPIGTNVKAYVSLIATGRFQEALDVAREPNPFPGICGRVCTHPCEQKCNRAEHDEPVAIAWLKRFAADYELRRGIPTPERVTPWRKEKVAVVGGGPAGLTAARDLVLKGYPVTVFEALDKPGGMMVGGIPTFRLPRRIVSLEIKAIQDLGVDIKTGVTFGKDVTLESLKADGYKAVLLAVGAWKSQKLGAKGEDTEGVYDCIAFLNRVNEGKHPDLKGRVAVIGGGNSAVDSARAAVRMGADSVAIYYRRTEKEMPAAASEVEEAKHEGVEVNMLVAPVEVVAKDGRVAAMRLQKMRLGEPDSSGRRRPVPIEGSEYTVETDHIISAIGQKPDLKFAEQMKELKLTSWGTLQADERTLACSMPGVFAAGDAVTGPATVVEAIAAGHRSAAGIHSYLSGEKLVLPSTGLTAGPREYQLKMPKPAPMKRRPVRKRKVADLKHNFEEVELGYDELSAMEEALRCMRCGPCHECRLCIQECKKEVMVFAGSNGDAPPVVVRVPHDMRIALDGAEAVLTPPAGDAAGPGPVEGRLVNVVCTVNEEMCRGCGTCEAVCLYAAPRVSYRKDRNALVASVNEKECKGCGTCAAMCPSGAMQQKYFTEKHIFRELEEQLAQERGKTA